MYSIPRLNDDRQEAGPHPRRSAASAGRCPRAASSRPGANTATQTCIDEEPELKQVADGQQVRCFYPDEGGSEQC